MSPARAIGCPPMETKFVYGVTGPVYSNDILAAIRYPDKSTGSASTSEQETYTVNALGQQKSKTDRNGNVHSYTFDVLGRLTIDAVTTLGTGVNGAVRRLETAYDGQGNAYLVTSYDAATLGNIVNQVQRDFNGLGQLTREYQAHAGQVVLPPSSPVTPNVQYAYSEMAGGVNHSRATNLFVPRSLTVRPQAARGQGKGPGSGRKPPLLVIVPGLCSGAPERSHTTLGRKRAVVQSKPFRHPLMEISQTCPQNRLDSIYFVQHEST